MAQAPKNPAAPSAPATPMRFSDKRESEWVNLTTLFDNQTVFTLTELDFRYDREGRQQVRAACYDATTGERLGTLSTTGVIVVEQLKAFLGDIQWDWSTVIGPLTIGKGERAFYLSDASGG